MDKNIVMKPIHRATLWSAAFALAACLAVAPKAVGQDRDNQRVTPSQSEQAPDMQRPDNPNEPAITNPDQQREMDRRSDWEQDRDRDAAGNDHDMNWRETAEFNRFLDHHPEVAEDLQHNPDLVNDRRYVASHEELRDFLKDHPQIRHELKENPQSLLSGDRRHDRDDRDDDRRDEQRPPQL